LERKGKEEEEREGEGGEKVNDRSIDIDSKP